MIKRVITWYKNLPEQKKYVELVTAALSVPVLLSVLTLNISNINEKKTNSAEQTTPTETVRESVVYIPITGAGSGVKTSEPTSINDAGSAPSGTDACIKEIGPIDIESPQEGQEVQENPVRIRIVYDQGDYCSVVWSYRINDGAWSEFDDTSIALYDMKAGEKTVEVRVKSLASKQEKLLNRSFYYSPPVLADEDEDNTATNSASES